jgi:hypothetical protein
MASSHAIGGGKNLRTGENSRSSADERWLGISVSARKTTLLWAASAST